MKARRVPHAPRLASSLDIRGLEMFVAVVETQSMTRAAQQLSVTQPAVSFAVAQLEEALGSTLLDRTTRPLRPTAAGLLLHRRARRILSDVESLRGAVSTAGGRALPNIRIGLVASVTALGAPLILALQALADELRVWSTLTPHLASALRDRDLDILITSEALDDTPDLERRLALEEPFVFAVPREFAAARRNITLPLLCDALPFIRYTNRSNIGNVIERYVRRRRLDPPHRLEFDSSASVLEMVSAGLGWAITTPLCLMQSAVSPDSIALRPLDGAPLIRGLYVIARQNELPGTAERVRDVVAGLARELLEQRVRGGNAWMLQGVKYG
jgi:DNA-binding transcriptional LysR family regulator